MWDQAIELGYDPPKALQEWGSIGEYHLEETWPGKIPPHVQERRKLYQHYVTLSYGLARGKVGWWEKRAEQRLRDGNFKLGKLEARGPWRHMLLEYVADGEPATDLGAAEAAWHAQHHSA